jgi:hypothetical protein
MITPHQRILNPFEGVTAGFLDYRYVWLARGD